MPIQPIGFGPRQASGQEELSGASKIAMNVIIDMKGTVRRRPGIVAYAEAPTTAIDASGIEGLYITNDDRLFAVGGYNGGRHLYKIDSGAYVDLSGVADGVLIGTERPTFAETEALLVIATGNAPHKMVLADEQTSRLGGNPPFGSHVIANSSRLLLNDTLTDKSAISYSATDSGTTYAGHEQWGIIPNVISGYIYAQSRPDPIIAVHENLNEIFAFGTGTIQIFTPSESKASFRDYDYVAVTTKELGCLAPYSIIKVDNNFAWLDHKRRFIISNGREHEIISAPIQQTLMEIGTIEDCFGYRVTEGPMDCFVWTFPTDGRSFVYQQNVGWGQWSGTSNAKFCVQSHTYRNSDGKNIVGTVDGVVAKMDMDAASDLGDRINAYVESGFINRGTEALKLSQAVYVTMRRGETTSSSESVMFLRWADAPDQWHGRIPVSLGHNNDRETTVVLRGLGTYRRRNWRIEFTGSENMVLSSITENYEILENTED